MIVYLARAIQAFVMYCVNGTSCSSLLIESTDSMILSGAHKGRSVQLGGMAFESDQLEHLPYMDLSSSGA